MARSIRPPAILILALLCAALPVWPVSAGADPKGDTPRTGRYIVVLEEMVEEPADFARNQAERHDGELGFVYRHALNGYSARLPVEEVEELRSDPAVKYVTVDHVLEFQAQSVPTGASRVFVASNEMLDVDSEDDLQAKVDVAVIDSGVDHEHDDLNVVERADCSIPTGETYTCIKNSGTPSGAHGTHVAGTIGAKDNGLGVVGVAPGARLWSVKISGGTVKQFESSTIAGVDWVTARANQIEVANMSIGCTEGFFPGCTTLPALEGAVSKGVKNGVVFVVAAGNENVDVKKTHPASNPDVITVSALADYDGQPGGKSSPSCENRGNDDARASFSNYGKDIEIAAPGVCILSTVPGDKYAEVGWSGTSMASPHVAGAAALLASLDNPNTKADVEAIRATLIEEGNYNWTDTSGDGTQEPLLDVSDEALFKIVRPPEVTTEAAAYVASETARLPASINPNGYATDYQFEYGTTTEYGTVVPVLAESVGSGELPILVDRRLDGLEPGTTYHFRATATNSSGTAYGKDQSFTTSTSGFKGEGYPLTLEGEAAHAFAGTMYVGSGGGYVCPPGPFETTLGEADETLTTDNVSGAACPPGYVTMDMNECKFTFEPGKETKEDHFAGTLSIGPPECGPVALDYYLAPVCEILIEPDDFDAAVSFENVESDRVDVHMNAVFDYTVTFCAPGVLRGYWKNVEWTLRSSSGADISVSEPLE